MVRAVAASAQKPVEEEEEVTVATMMVYVLALAWLISYASFLWVESLPAELPCAWGIHGCAPHALCQAGWPPSLFSLPSCEQLPPRTLPRNHPPVPAGAGLCSAALASLGAARCRKPWPAHGSARMAPRRPRPCQSMPEHASGRPELPPAAAAPLLVLRRPVPRRGWRPGATYVRHRTVTTRLL